MWGWMAVSPKTTAFSLWPLAGQSLITLPGGCSRSGKRAAQERFPFRLSPYSIFHFYPLFLPPRICRLADVSDACPVTSIFVSGPKKQEEQGRIPGVPRFPRQCVVKGRGERQPSLSPLLSADLAGSGIVAAQPSDSQ